ncbi:MAG: hypothetical protein ACOH17_04380 [Cellulomonas sp.]
MVRTSKVPVDLHDRTTQTLRETVATVYWATPRGAAVLVPARVAGTGVRVALAARGRPSLALAAHTCGVAELASWYRRSGFSVAAERQIVSLERPTPVAGRKVQNIVAWTVKVPGAVGVHPPDLGAVDKDGGRWAVELERDRSKTVIDYLGILGAYRASSTIRGQVWHVLVPATSAKIHTAAQRLGFQWAPAQAGAGLMVTTCGTLRMARWRPGTSLDGPASWAERLNFPAGAPAGLDAVAGPDTRDQWRQGTTVDVMADLWEPYEPFRMVA